MEIIFVPLVEEAKKEKAFLEKKLKVKITFNGKKVILEGNSLDEYEAKIVFEAIAFGYDSRTAVLLKDEEFAFRRMSIRDFTRRKDLEVVKARVIGTQGRTKKTLENLADCKIIVRENEVGIIASAEEIEYVLTALSNLIRGSKQSNVYKFLERINTQKKHPFDEEEKTEGKL